MDDKGPNVEPVHLQPARRAMPNVWGKALVRLKLLGPLELELSDRTPAVAVVAQPKRLAILAYLAAMKPSGFRHRDELLALFWPETDDRHARNSLRQALHFLRDSLGKETLVCRGREHVGVDPERIECDVLRFERAIEDGRLQEAMRLYSGPLLAGLHVSDAPEFMGWLDRRREELRRAALEASRSRGRAALNVGRWEEALAALRDGLRVDPYDEPLLRELLRSLWGAGDRASALREYDIFAKRLRTDLDLEPSAETEAVLRGLRASGPSLHRDATPRLDRLAVLPFTNLTGRVDQQYVADAMHDAVIAELAQLRTPSVTSRQSVLQYRDTEKTLPDIARELDVDFLAVGSVLRFADGIRITLRLLQAWPSEQHLCVHTFGHDSHGLVAVDMHVARVIARRIQEALMPQQPEASGNPRL